MKKMVTFLGISMIVLSLGCSGSKNAVSEELRAELDGYKNEIAAQKNEIATLKKGLTAVSKNSADGELSAMKSDINTNKTDIRLTRAALKSMQSSLEDMQGASPLIDSTNRILLDDIQLLKSQVRELNEKMSDRPAAVPAVSGTAAALPSAASGRTQTRAAAAKSLSPTEYRSAYVNTLSKFQNGQYAEARAGFQELITSSASNDLADNAQYWIGECYYMEKKYEEAILAFEKVFTFSDRGKYDDAQFKLGLCYRKLGNTAKAIDEFERLINYYEDSEWRNQAQNILSKLK